MASVKRIVKRLQDLPTIEAVGHDQRLMVYNHDVFENPKGISVDSFLDSVGHIEGGGSDENTHGIFEDLDTRITANKTAIGDLTGKDYTNLVAGLDNLTDLLMERTGVDTSNFVLRDSADEQAISSDVRFSGAVRAEGDIDALEDDLGVVNRGYLTRALAHTQSFDHPFVIEGFDTSANVLVSRYGVSDPIGAMDCGYVDSSSGVAVNERDFFVLGRDGRLGNRGRSIHFDLSSHFETMGTTSYRIVDLTGFPSVAQGGTDDFENRFVVLVVKTIADKSTLELHDFEITIGTDNAPVLTKLDAVYDARAINEGEGVDGHRAIGVSAFRSDVYVLQRRGLNTIHVLRFAKSDTVGNTFGLYSGQGGNATGAVSHTYTFGDNEDLRAMDLRLLDDGGTDRLYFYVSVDKVVDGSRQTLIRRYLMTGANLSLDVNWGDYAGGGELVPEADVVAFKFTDQYEAFVQELNVWIFTSGQYLTSEGINEDVDATFNFGASIHHYVGTTVTYGTGTSILLGGAVVSSFAIQQVRNSPVSGGTAGDSYLVNRGGIKTLIEDEVTGGSVYEDWVKGLIEEENSLSDTDHPLGWELKSRETAFELFADAPQNSAHIVTGFEIDGETYYLSQNWWTTYGGGHAIVEGGADLRRLIRGNDSEEGWYTPVVSCVIGDKLYLGVRNAISRFSINRDTQRLTLDSVSLILSNSGTFDATHDYITGLVVDGQYLYIFKRDASTTSSSHYRIEYVRLDLGSETGLITQALLAGASYVNNLPYITEGSSFLNQYRMTTATRDGRVIYCVFSDVDNVRRLADRTSVLTSHGAVFLAYGIGDGGTLEYGTEEQGLSHVFSGNRKHISFYEIDKVVEPNFSLIAEPYVVNRYEDESEAEVVFDEDRVRSIAREEVITRTAPNPDGWVLTNHHDTVGDIFSDLPANPDRKIVASAYIGDSETHELFLSSDGYLKGLNWDASVQVMIEDGGTTRTLIEQLQIDFEDSTIDSLLIPFPDTFPDSVKNSNGGVYPVVFFIRSSDLLPIITIRRSEYIQTDGQNIRSNFFRENAGNFSYSGGEPSPNWYAVSPSIPFIITFIDPTPPDNTNPGIYVFNVNVFSQASNLRRLDVRGIGDGEVPDMVYEDRVTEGGIRTTYWVFSNVPLRDLNTGEIIRTDPSNPESDAVMGTRILALRSSASFSIGLSDAVPLPGLSVNLPNYLRPVKGVYFNHLKDPAELEITYDDETFE